jgi:hypothetical protein
VSTATVFSPRKVGGMTSSAMERDANGSGGPVTFNCRNMDRAAIPICKSSDRLSFSEFALIIASTREVMAAMKLEDPTVSEFPFWYPPLGPSRPSTTGSCPNTFLASGSCNTERLSDSESWIASYLKLEGVDEGEEPYRDFKDTGRGGSAILPFSFVCNLDRPILGG